MAEVDQTPIGKTPRSCPATYVGFWDDVRKQFADTREARMRGWTAARFSFNTGDGRCPICEGQGMRTIEMNFLPDVKVPCDACNGARFNNDTLSVQMRGKNAGELLSMEVDDAIGYFAAHPKIHRPLQLMQDVGLGYLTLGQPSPTLSGGELQRAITSNPRLRGRVHLLSVSFDPDQDTPEVLTAHAKKAGADPTVWSFATAPRDVVDRFAATFGVNVIREADGTVTHNLRTAVIDQQGRVVQGHDSNQWTSAQVLDDLDRSLTH